ncbi:anti-repressor SinI family protein [Peribacillus butanolivorans]|nr:anti-repressor SinI family protein [Peribacillus butanolivorans]
MQKKIDAEWVHLILEAKSLGVSIQEVRDFIQNEQKLNNQPHKNWN